MNQPTHAWIAVRAIALLEDEGTNTALVELLRPNAPQAAIGAWMPDLQDAKRSRSSATECHVLKIAPYQPDPAKRFVTTAAQLTKLLGPARQMPGFIATYGASLDDAWWSQSYRGDVNKPGQHVANRAMAMATTIADLLLLGDSDVDALYPKPPKFAANLAAHARTTEEQAVLHFFMSSHFLADACMPCHCDARALSAYSAGGSKSLHHEIEVTWGNMVGDAFTDEQLLKQGTGTSADDLMSAARAADGTIGLTFAGPVPTLTKTDVWLDTVSVCRASFTLASIIAPPATYPYAGSDTPDFDTIFGAMSDQQKADFHATVLHDAVLNVATAWKYVWGEIAKATGTKATAPDAGN